jgi:hypothetical protein
MCTIIYYHDLRGGCYTAMEMLGFFGAPGPYSIVDVTGNGFRPTLAPPSARSPARL